MSILNFLFSFNGRINRSGWWFYFVCAPALHAFLVAIIQIAHNGRYSEFTSMFVLLFLPLLFVDIAVCVKRFHDLADSGWFVLFGLIPIFGWCYIIVVCGFLKGTDDDNEFGPPPRNIFE